MKHGKRVGLYPHPSPLKQVISLVLFTIFLLVFVPILKFCPPSSTDLVSVTGAWSLVWGLMAGLQGFASHEGSIPSGGQAVEVEARGGKS